jgi:outer membrane protein TolC
VGQVWSAHFNFATAGKQLESAKALLSSASQSFDVSLARYQAGAANIVELMTTQAQLAQARAQLIGARQSLYSSYAELIHAIGAPIFFAGVSWVYFRKLIVAYK